MLPITQKGILLGILLSLIAALSTLGIFLLFQKKQNTEKLKGSSTEAIQTEAPDAGTY